MTHEREDGIPYATAGDEPLTIAETGHAGTVSAWRGRSGNMAYLAKMFPRVSETFILREFLTLRQEGIPLRIYSLLPPTRDARIQPQAEALLPEVVVLPQPGSEDLGRFLADLFRCFRVRPAATLRELLRTLKKPDKRNRRRLFRAVCLAARLKQDRVAHVHAAWAHTPASVSRIACRLAAVPWSMGAHAKDIHLSSPASLAKKMRVARFTTVCTRAKQELLEDIGKPEEPDLPHPSILMNYHGVDTDFFSAPEDPEEGVPRPGEVPMVLSVGRLVAKKGFDTLLDAVALLRDRGVPFRLEVVGTGPLKASIKEQIRKLGLEKTVNLRGMLVLEEVRKAYGEAFCVTLASRVAPNGDRDGIPNTLAEAMASGVPVVTTRLPSIQELVKDGDTGLLVPPDNPGALADALERLLNDPALARRLGRAGRSWVRENFNSVQCGKQLAKRLAHTLGIERMLYLSPDRGVPVRGNKGASVHVRAVVGATTRMGVEVRLVTSRPGPKDGHKLSAPMIRANSGDTMKKLVGRLARWTGGGLPLERAVLRVIDNIFVYSEAHRQAKAWRPEVIYERYALTAVAGSLLARRLGIPHILEVNAPLAKEEEQFRGLRLGFLAHWVERWLLRRADRIFVVSQALAEHALRLGAQDRRIVVMPNAIDPEIFHPQRDGRAVRERFGLDNHFVLGFSGTLKPWHGLHHLLHAVASARSELPDAHLLVMGEGPERQELEDLARKLNLASRTHFTGFIPHDEVGDYLAACDLLTAPYGPLDDHWFSPLKVAEYLAVGRPVVASAIGQLKERLGEKQGVVLVPPGDEDSLSKTLVRIAQDTDWRTKLARNTLAAPPRTWKDVVRRVLEEGEAARRELWGWEP